METILENTVCEGVYIKMPPSDMDFFQLFAEKMGWLIDKKQNLWEKYIENRPQNIDLTDEEIMEEVKAIRYNKM